ncbi:MAG TPA: MFS transporter [bacterium]
MNRQFWVAVALLWLAGNALRLTILAVPPVLPLITRDLHLSGTEVGILGSIPPALFALAAVPGSLLIARVGALRALVIGLLLAAVGGALRGLSVNTLTLFSTTVLMSIGVAFMQPALPPAVQQWLPTRVGFGTAVYTNGLLVGETFPVFLTLPLVLPWLDGSWGAALAFWSVPVLIIAAIIAVGAPRPTAGATTAIRRQWWPQWRSGMLWQLGMLAGGISSMYFASNVFLPGYLAHIGRPDLPGSALTALNLGQIPASLMLLAIADKLERRAWPYLVTGVVSLASLLGIVYSGGIGIVVWSAVLGFNGSIGLILALSLPALLSTPDQVARIAAGMFAISYGTAVAVSVIAGGAWDVAGTPAAAFLVIACSAALLLAAAVTLLRGGHLR